MSAAKHTPGEWRVLPVSNKTQHLGIYDDAGNQVALVSVKSALALPRRAADARVMAASPALLEALRVIRTCNLEGFPGDVIACVDAAIAKATVAAPRNAAEGKPSFSEDGFDLTSTGSAA